MPRPPSARTVRHPAGAALALSVLVFAGCASPGDPSTPADSSQRNGLVVRADVDRLLPAPPAAAVAPQVSVIDLRERIAMERTTIGGISMGVVRTQPEPVEAVGALVGRAASAALARRPGAPAPAVACGIRRFDIVTPATMFYWDVTTEVELVLRIRGIERRVAARSVERTWIYPTVEMLQRVTDAALADLARDTETAILELLDGATR